MAGRGGTTCPPTSCPSWSPEALRGREEWLDKIPEDAWAGGQGPEAGGGPGRGQAASGRSFLPRALAACVPSTGDPPRTPLDTAWPSSSSYLRLRGLDTEPSRGCMSSHELGGEAALTGHLLGWGLKGSVRWRPQVWKGHSGRGTAGARSAVGTHWRVEAASRGPGVARGAVDMPWADKSGSWHLQTCFLAWQVDLAGDWIEDPLRWGQRWIPRVQVSSQGPRRREAGGSQRGGRGCAAGCEEGEGAMRQGPALPTPDLAP